MKLKRTHYCGQVTEANIDQEVTLCGWVHRWRDHGGVVFIDLRDREGVAQVVFDPKETSVDEAATLRQETVIAIKGKVRLRPDGMANKKIPTGLIEVAVQQLEILSRADALPYPLHEDSPSAGSVDESLRLKYRYLDLRSQRLQNNLKTRSQFLRSVRNFYHDNGFWEVETPILYKSTPEGARDYLVPSRLHPGQFYALPQSPQTLKQICMISGFDKYFQIAKCFRDEDLRADRQPEFTQIDVEMSFIESEDIFQLHESLMKQVFKDVLNKDLKTPFARLPYSVAMEKYGSDKPDLRNSLELIDLTECGKKSEFKVYQSVLSEGGILKGLCFEEKTPLSRSELDGLAKKVAPFGAKGLSWIRIKSPGDWQAPQAKFFPEALKTEIESKLPFTQNAMLLMVCASPKVVNASLGHLRLEYGNKLGYTNEDEFNFAWITDFPLFVYDEEVKRLFAAHHPFTNPHDEDLETFMKETDPKKLEAVRANAYDLVLNGFEIGGGSLRIFDSKVQKRMFQALGMTEAEANDQFGFFMQALSYGTPPHGGIALGVDRVTMLLTGEDAIRDVMAFPKTQKASDLMSSAPSNVSEKQLEELSLRVRVQAASAKDNK